MVQETNVGGVEDIFVDDRNSGYIVKHFSDGELSDLVNADSIDRKVDILNGVLRRARFPDSFISDLYISAKQAFVERITELFIDKKKSEEKKLGINRGPTGGTIEQPIRNPVKIEKNITVKRNGKEYKKSYKRWTAEEEMMINAYKSANTVQLKEILTDRMGFERTESSIRTKRRRLYKLNSGDDNGGQEIIS